MAGAEVATGYACLGISWLGNCAYNPASPTSIYLSLGEAISSLGFIVAVQQLLKPIYIFRLEARFVTVGRLYAFVFCAAVCALIASVVPSLPRAQWLGPFDYPIVWEILSASLFAVAYGAVALAAVLPIRVSPNNITKFAQASAQLLSSASDRDHIDFVRDLRRSLPVLVKEARFNEGHYEPSAFFLFTNRRRMGHASYAASLLHILSDSRFCKTLVDRVPWEASRMMRDLELEAAYAKAAEPFVREMGRQAITSADSMLEREIAFTGFRSAPLLSDSLFASPFIVDNYNPLESFRFQVLEIADPDVLRRFNAATRMCFEASEKLGLKRFSSLAVSVHSAYGSIFHAMYRVQRSGKREHFNLTFEIDRGVEAIISIASEMIVNLSDNECYALYKTSADQHRSDALELMAEIVFDALTGMSNEFQGYGDHFWTMALNVFGKAFEKHGDEEGLTPFQQRLGLMILSKLRDNMNGFYPAIMRVLMWCVYPRLDDRKKDGAPIVILARAVHSVLRDFPALASREPSKVRHYLPENVRYNFITEEFTHVYSDGAEKTSKVNTTLGNVDLTDPVYWRVRPPER